MHLNMVQANSCGAMRTCSSPCAGLSSHTMFSLGVTLQYPWGKRSWKQFGGFLPGSGCVWGYTNWEGILHLETICWNMSSTHSPEYRSVVLFTYVARKDGPILVQQHNAGSARCCCSPHNPCLIGSLIWDQMFCSSKPRTRLHLEDNTTYKQQAVTLVLYTSTGLRYLYFTRVPLVCHFNKF